MKIVRALRAAPEEAVALLADFSRLPEYNPGVRTEGARAGRAQVGDRFDLFVRFGPGRIRVRCHVVESDERRVRFSADAIVPAMETRFADPAADGCTVGWEIAYDVPWWLGGRVSQRLVFDPFARRQIETELDGVQRMLEER